MIESFADVMTLIAFSFGLIAFSFGLLLIGISIGLTSKKKKRGL